jgi:hypothetical protein
MEGDIGEMIKTLQAADVAERLKESAMEGAAPSAP